MKYIYLRKENLQNSLLEYSIPLSTSSNNLSNGKRETRRQLKVMKAVVNIVIVEATNLRFDKKNLSHGTYCKLTLGKEKIKTKSVENCSNPKWKEQLTMKWYDGTSSSGSGKLLMQVHSG